MKYFYPRKPDVRNFLLLCVHCNQYGHHAYVEGIKHKTDTGFTITEIGCIECQKKVDKLKEEFKPLIRNLN